MLFQEHKACETNKEKIIEAQVAIGDSAQEKTKILFHRLLSTDCSPSKMEVEL